MNDRRRQQLDLPPSYGEAVSLDLRSSAVGFHRHRSPVSADDENDNCYGRRTPPLASHSPPSLLSSPAASPPLLPPLLPRATLLRGSQPRNSLHLSPIYRPYRPCTSGSGGRADDANDDDDNADRNLFGSMACEIFWMEVLPVLITISLIAGLITLVYWPFHLQPTPPPPPLSSNSTQQSTEEKISDAVLFFLNDTTIIDSVQELISFLPQSLRSTTPMATNASFFKMFFWFETPPHSPPFELFVVLCPPPPSPPPPASSSNSPSSSANYDDDYKISCFAASAKASNFSSFFETGCSSSSSRESGSLFIKTISQLTEKAFEFEKESRKLAAVSSSSSSSSSSNSSSSSSNSSNS